MTKIKNIVRARLLIVDEAHHSRAPTFERTINSVSPNFILGLTATPFRSDGASVTDMFGAPLVHYDVKKGIKKKYLKEVSYKLMNDNMGVKVRVQPYSGSSTYIPLLNRDEVRFALVNVSDAVNATEGLAEALRAARDELQAMAQRHRAEQQASEAAHREALQRALSERERIEHDLEVATRGLEEAKRRCATAGDECVRVRRRNTQMERELASLRQRCGIDSGGGMDEVMESLEQMEALVKADQQRARFFRSGRIEESRLLALVGAASVADLPDSARPAVDGHGVDGAEREKQEADGCFHGWR